MLEELGLDFVPIVSLAKREEEVYHPESLQPLALDPASPALHALQRIRDEAHRFAITYHRSLRDKRMTKSILDDIPGLGPTRQKRLRKELGGVTGVKQATLEELQALSWLPDAVASAVYQKIHAPPTPKRPSTTPIPFKD